MCGIVGILSPESPAPEVLAVLQLMTDAVAHRGPDAQGVWNDGDAFLGHRRLSIIDLSDAGRQPMCDESGRYVIVYNGEVYNYLELRKYLEGRGYRFRTSSDTEVVLAAYREWGQRALERFNGMWAFAIWDRVARELFCARDRAGKKPFYYVVTPSGTLYFSSEIKSLIAAGFRFGVEPQAAFDFLTQGTYGHLHARGFFSGVSQLPAAHWMLVRSGHRPTVKPYWQPPIIARADRRRYDDEFRREFRETLLDAVRLRLRSDVPVGATLSGGLDSSTIVLLVDEITNGSPLHVFTSLFPGTEWDETPYFKAVANRLRRPLVHRVQGEEGVPRDFLTRIIDHQEEPFGDTSITAHYRLMEAARRAGVPVILSGQGGDELLLGYPSQVQAYLGSLVNGGHLLRAWREAASWAEHGRRPLVSVLRASLAHSLPLALRDRARRHYVARLSDIVSPRLKSGVSHSRYAPAGSRTAVDAYMQQVFTRFSLPHLLHYDDRNAMAFSVEGRMPFLDYRLVELVFSVQYEALFADGVTKRVLRDAFGDLLPPIVRNRRDKIGFYTPLARWLRAERDWIVEFMSRERIEGGGLLDATHWLSRLSALLAGDDRAELHVWRGLILTLWMERFDVAPFGETYRADIPITIPARA